MWVLGWGRNSWGKSESGQKNYVKRQGAAQEKGQPAEGEKARHPIKSQQGK